MIIPTILLYVLTITNFWAFQVLNQQTRKDAFAEFAMNCFLFVGIVAFIATITIILFHA